MKRILLHTLVLLVLASLSGTAAPPVPAERPVVHVVIVWLKDPANPAAAAKMIAASKAFKDVPGLRSVKTGRMVPSPRPIVDSTFQVGVVMEFESKAALDAYLASESHRRETEQTLKPLAARVQVYDFLDE